MKVTCSLVKALEACLADRQQTAHVVTHRNKYSQPSANIDIATWNLGSSKEGMATVTSGTGNLNRVAAAVRFGGIKRYCATLVTVGSVCCPGCLVPAALEVVGDLSKR